MWKDLFNRHNGNTFSPTALAYRELDIVLSVFYVTGLWFVLSFHFHEVFKFHLKSSNSTMYDQENIKIG